MHCSQCVRKPPLSPEKAWKRSVTNEKRNQYFISSSVILYTHTAFQLCAFGTESDTAYEYNYIYFY